MATKKKAYKLIYNPNAGKKRSKIPFVGETTLHEIKELLKQYEIEADYFPTKRPGHAIQLAFEARREGYPVVLVAGGDGTVSEAASGLVGSHVALGIIPIGSVMNLARMLHIPQDLEKAIILIKLGRTRRIDVGEIAEIHKAAERSTTKRGTTQKRYFLESLGLGLEAELQEEFLNFEQGDFLALWRFARELLSHYALDMNIELDGKKIEATPTLVTIANGPYLGAALKLSPKAKLTDRRLTVSVFRMNIPQLFLHVMKIMFNGSAKHEEISTYKAKKVRVKTKIPIPVHADARIFGFTPVEVRIVPAALSVISGFSKE